MVGAQETFPRNLGEDLVDKKSCLRFRRNLQNRKSKEKKSSALVSRKSDEASPTAKSPEGIQKSVEAELLTEICKGLSEI